jgi:hypothetical protein
VGVIVAEKHTILGGKVHVYQRENSSVWQCSSYLEGRNRRVSTKEESLAKAKEFAEDWYLELRGKKARGELLSELTFAQAAERFTKEYELMTAGERNEIYVKGHSEPPLVCRRLITSCHATISNVLSCA